MRVPLKSPLYLSSRKPWSALLKLEKSTATNNLAQMNSAFSHLSGVCWCLAFTFVDNLLWSSKKRDLRWQIPLWRNQTRNAHALRKNGFFSAINEQYSIIKDSKARCTVFKRKLSNLCLRNTFRKVMKRICRFSSWKHGIWIMTFPQMATRGWDHSIWILRWKINQRL